MTTKTISQRDSGGESSGQSVISGPTGQVRPKKGKVTEGPILACKDQANPDSRRTGDGSLTPRLPFRAGQDACSYFFLNYSEIFWMTIAEDRGDQGLASAVARDKASFLPAPLDLREQMRRAEVADKVEMHS